MQRAGVTPIDYATAIVEILADNADPLAGEGYAALDMPFAVLVDQIAQALTKNQGHSPSSQTRAGRPGAPSDRPADDPQLPEAFPPGLVRARSAGRPRHARCERVAPRRTYRPSLRRDERFHGRGCFLGGG